MASSFIGSADWMDRNLSRRVEAVTPVDARHLRERLWETLQVQLQDQRNSWEMRPDGTYIRPDPDEIASSEIGARRHPRRH